MGVKPCLGAGKPLKSGAGGSRPPGAMGVGVPFLVSFPNSIGERVCGRNSIAAAGERRSASLSSSIPAIELPEQGRSQMEFGNEGRKGCIPQDVACQISLLVLQEIHTVPTVRHSAEVFQCNVDTSGIPKRAGKDRFSISLETRILGNGGLCSLVTRSDTA